MKRTTLAALLLFCAVVWGFLILGLLLLVRHACLTICSKL